MLRFVITYLGDVVPNYVFKNLIRISSTFPKHETILISDNKDALIKAANLGLDTWDAEESFKRRMKQLGNLKHDMSFRRGFWLNTLARLLVLCDFIIETRSKMILQVEADVILLDSFPTLEFERLKTLFAFGIENEDKGIAALLFLKDDSAAEFLDQFISACITKDVNATDMTILGELVRTQSKKVTVLPSMIEPNKDNKQSDLLHDVVVAASPFGGVFDPITLGQYYFGEDPRNHRGIRIRGRRQHHHLLNPQNINVEVGEFGEISLKANSGKNWPLFSIHNHAKDDRLFSKKLDRKYLSKRFQPLKKPKYDLIALALFEVSLQAIKRRLPI